MQNEGLAGGARVLQGKRVVITRAREQAEELAAKVRARGAVPLNWPMIAIAPPLDEGPLRAAMERIGKYDWIIFSSANGVQAFGERLSDQTAPMPRIAAVGPSTAAALERYGLRAEAVPDEFMASRMADVLGDVAGRAILVVRPDVAPQSPAGSLRAKGATVDEVGAYRTIIAPDEGPLALDHVDAIAFASASAATEFAARLRGQSVPAHICIACIGPSTAQAACAAGLPATVVAHEHTLDGLVTALVEHFTREVER
jgi:uroporphyrinogen-III synthase